jgi:hypothetical protein
MARISLLLLALGAPGIAFADNAPKTPASRAALGDWPVEKLRIKNGRTLSGLVQKEDDREIEFVEVVRNPGKEMHLVVRPIPRSEVAEIKRLGAEQRLQLEKRIEHFKHRSRIEAAQADEVQLTKSQKNGRDAYAYDSPEFLLQSTSSEDITRLAVVRLDQIFRAYRHALPPRSEPRQRIEIILHGSMEQYRAYLAENQLEIDHPAFFWADKNLIVAGADLDRYREQLRKAHGENEEVRGQYQELDRQFEAGQAEWRARLVRQKAPAAQMQAELAARRAAWTREHKAMMDKITAANRRNQARYQQVEEQFFARLRHEAFHAYVENYLYPRAQYDVPRWLNEGLAQVFERGRLDGETLRIDAPDPDWLPLLQADLTGGYRLPLAELLAAPDADFLAVHGHVDSTDRRYLYSWGLAWHLLFERDLVSGEKLEQYVRQNAAAPPRVRFEQFVGQKLSEFEPAWINAMLELRAPARR